MAALDPNQLQTYLAQRPRGVDANAWNEYTLPIRDLYGTSGATPSESDVSNAFNRMHDAAQQYFPQQVGTFDANSSQIKQNLGNFGNYLQQPPFGGDGGNGFGGFGQKAWDTFRWNWNYGKPADQQIGAEWGDVGKVWGLSRRPEVMSWLSSRYQQPTDTGAGERVSAWV